MIRFPGSSLVPAIATATCHRCNAVQFTQFSPDRATAAGGRTYSLQVVRPRRYLVPEQRAISQRSKPKPNWAKKYLNTPAHGICSWLERERERGGGNFAREEQGWRGENGGGRGSTLESRWLLKTERTTVTGLTGAGENHRYDCYHCCYPVPSKPVEDRVATTRTLLEMKETSSELVAKQGELL